MADDTSPLGKTVSNVGEIITRVTAIQRSMLFALVALMDSSLWISLCQLLCDTESRIGTAP